MLLGSLVLNSLDQKAMSRPVLVIVGVTVLLTATATSGAVWFRKSRRIRCALKWMPWIVAPIGFEVGFSSAGAGALGTIVLMRYTSLIPAEVVGTDLAFGLLLSIFAGGIHASMTGVPWVILVKLLAGGIPAVMIGTQLVSVLSPKNAPGVVYLACLHRRTAIVARHHRFRGNQSQSRHNRHAPVGTPAIMRFS